MTNHRITQSGFTIVELMIATTVFSVILLAVTTATMTISKAYQRSMYASNTQAAASNLVDVLSQAVRFSSGPVQKVGNETEIEIDRGTAMQCIGGTEFLYSYGRRVGDTVTETSSMYGVVSRPTKGCGAVDQITGAAPALTNHKELLGRGMRLSKLEISQPGGGSAYRITVRVIYGEDDLICSDSVTNSCTPGSSTLTSSQLKNTDLRCKPGSGSEFCSATELTSIVYRRI